MKIPFFKTAIFLKSFLIDRNPAWYALFSTKMIDYCLRDMINFIPDDFYESMKGVCYGGVPVWIKVKFMAPDVGSRYGDCYDRSLLMFMTKPDAELVRGDVYPLEKEFGKEKAGHGWIEIGDYVYDPTTLMKYQKKAYYDLQKPKITRRFTHAEYDNNWLARSEGAILHPYSDYCPGGERRDDLLFTAPNILEISKDNREFREAYQEFLDEVHYDPDEKADKSRYVINHIADIPNTPMGTYKNFA